MINLLLPEKEIRLKTDGYDIIFFLSRAKYKTQVEMFICIESQLDTSTHSITSIKETVSKKDLLDLCDYFQTHINKLKNGTNTDANPYLDYSMLYHVQTLIGSWNKNTNELDFGLSFLVNVGWSATKTRVWLGGQTGVLARNVEAFIRELRDYLEQ